MFFLQGYKFLFLMDEKHLSQQSVNFKEILENRVNCEFQLKQSVVYW